MFVHGQTGNSPDDLHVRNHTKSQNSAYSNNTYIARYNIAQFESTRTLFITCK